LECLSAHIVQASTGSGGKPKPVAGGLELSRLCRWFETKMARCPAKPACLEVGIVKSSAGAVAPGSRWVDLKAPRVRSSLLFLYASLRTAYADVSVGPASETAILSLAAQALFPS